MGVLLGNFNCDLIRQHTPYGCVLNPRKCLDLASSLIQWNEKDALAAIRRKNTEDACLRDVVISGRDNLLRMNQGCFRRS